MKASAQEFDKIVNERRSVRIYDENAAWDEKAVERSLERAMLAPNSSNLQLWEFYRVSTPDKKAELAEICLGQNAAKTAKELIVIVTRKDKWKERRNFVFNKAKSGFDGQNLKAEKLVDDYYNKIIPALYTRDFLGVFGFIKKVAVTLIGISKPMAREVTAADVRVVVHKSAALAAQTFMLSMKAEGFDSCPMEGFDSVKTKKFLKLPSQAEINMIIAVGTAKEQGIYGPRVRVNASEVIHQL